MTNTEHNATDEYACTECGHYGNGQVPGCTCTGCDDACGKSLVEWPYGNCTERSGHTGDCDRRKTTPRHSEEIRDVDIVELTATWLGLPAYEQSAVQAWNSEDCGYLWTEAEAAELAEQWKRDLRDGMRY